jgi:plastocyanin
MTTRRLTAATAFVLLALVASACGGDDPGPGPSGGGGTGGTGNVAETITITAAGVSPKNVTVTPGSRVTFVNNDSRRHDMSSDPHPSHTDCPEVNVGDLGPGQSGTTQNLNISRNCGFHDHNQPGVTSLEGTIRIQ